MNASTAASTRHYRIGTINVAVSGDYAEALDDFERLYGDARQRTAAPDAIHIAAEAAGGTWLGGRRYRIVGDGERVFGPRPAGEVLPYLEWGINWRVVARRDDFIQLHAATLVHGGGAVLLAGNSGVGKSTTAAALLKQGWTYFGDEFALIDPRTLMVSPFPKAICLKHGSFKLARELGLKLWRRRHYAKEFKGPIGYVNPHAVGPVGQAPAPVRTLIFLQHDAAAPPLLRPTSRAAAAIELGRCTFNPPAHPNLMDKLCDFVRGVRCFYLRTPDIQTTCRLVREAHG